MIIFHNLKCVSSIISQFIFLLSYLILQRPRVQISIWFTCSGIFVKPKNDRIWYSVDGYIYHTIWRTFIKKLNFHQKCFLYNIQSLNRFGQWIFNETRLCWKYISSSTCYVPSGLGQLWIFITNCPYYLIDIFVFLQMLSNRIPRSTYRSSLLLSFTVYPISIKLLKPFLLNVKDN